MEPNSDGVDHINVYSKGRTELGRMLTNFHRHPFQFEGIEFASLEAWWYYELLREAGVYIRLNNNELSTELALQLTTLPTTWGISAKTLGTRLTAGFIGARSAPSQQFRERYALAAAARLQSDTRLLRLLRDSNLPLMHYYWFGRSDKLKVIRDTKHQWVLDIWVDFRKQLQDEVAGN